MSGIERWPDWRYRLVNAADVAFHIAFPEREFGPLCNLERRMWWARYNNRASHTPNTLRDKVKCRDRRWMMEARQ